MDQRSWAVVTGAGRGIGQKVAVKLAQNGHNLLLLARSKDELESCAEVVREAGGVAEVIVTDLNDDDSLKSAIHQITTNDRQVRVLVNNAGGGKHASIKKIKIDDWDWMIKVNLRAAMLLTKHLLPDLCASPGGAVINIASMAAKFPSAKGAMYAATKAGLVAFTHSLFEECRQSGLKVSAILPGYVDTPLIPENRKLDREKMISSEEVAQAVMYILNSGERVCPVEISLRPQYSPYR